LRSGIKMADRFFIAPYDQESGIKRNVEPWLIPDSAFATLNNAYVFRGRVRKRFGSTWLGTGQQSSRLGVQLGTTDPVTGSFAGFVPLTGGVPIVTPAVGQAFSAGSQIFTINALGSPHALLASGTATAASFNATTGALSFTGDSATNLNVPVFYYPSLPVMGLRSQEGISNNDEPVIAFDTSWAYNYATTNWARISGENAPGDATWTGNNVNFFWTCNWTGQNAAANEILYVTNNNPNEPNGMRFLLGTTWYSFYPTVDGTNYLNCARILVPFKERLLAFNTWEAPINTYPGTNYQNRVRWSIVANDPSAFPWAAGPTNVNAWNQTIPGQGGGKDAPTTEAIITVEFVKDRLIVFFERSTYELVYTNNNVDPFNWQKLNTELGAESTFSVVPFDKVALTVGNVGIHSCNGVNVERLDDDIPDEVFAIHNDNDGPLRVYGIRDYDSEMVYWSFPDTTRTSLTPYNNQILVYNYKNGTWAFNDDSITCFGYYQPSSGVTWDSTTVTWDDPVPWDSGGLQTLSLNVIAGNQQGYTFIINRDFTTNASVIQITDAVATIGPVVSITMTAINHNFDDGDYIYIQGMTGGTFTGLNGTIQQIVVIDQNTFTIDSFIPAGIYTGGGTVSRVSNINFLTKEYNFYAQNGRNASINKVEFMVDATAGGQIQVDYYVDTSSDAMIEQAAASGTLVGTNILDTFPYPLIPREKTSERLWHPVYFQAQGEVIQLEFYLNEDQMENIEVMNADFQLHAMIFYAQHTGRLQ
jgi:hypothetical protein